MKQRSEFNAVEYTMTREEVFQTLQSTPDLPTLPSAFVHIMRILHDPTITVKQVALAVESDQAISMKVLKIINSSFYGLARSVDSVHQAIVLLGSQTLENIVVSMSIFKALGSGNKGSRFDREALWKHSIACGVIAKLLSERTQGITKEDAFLSGVIHDIGKVVIDRYLHDQLNAIFEAVESKGISFRQAELEVLQTDHAEIGALIAENWSLPPKLVEMIAKHHTFDPQSQYANLIALIQLADMIVRKHQVGSGGDDLVPEVEPMIWYQLNLNQDMLGAMDAQIRSALSTSSELFEIITK
ncbi:MAG: HDOD domain-containing protein [bacterium]